MAEDDTDLPDDDKQRARATLAEVLENQLRRNDPPEVRQTLERLLQAGFSRDAAKRLLLRALVEEIHEVLQGNEYERRRYAERLARLPEASAGAAGPGER